MLQTIEYSKYLLTIFCFTSFISFHTFLFSTFFVLLYFIHFYFPFFCFSEIHCLYIPFIYIVYIYRLCILTNRKFLSIFILRRNFRLMKHISAISYFQKKESPVWGKMSFIFTALCKLYMKISAYTYKIKEGSPVSE